MLVNTLAGVYNALLVFTKLTLELRHHNIALWSLRRTISRDALYPHSPFVKWYVYTILCVGTCMHKYYCRLIFHGLLYVN